MLPRLSSLPQTGGGHRVDGTRLAGNTRGLGRQKAGAFCTTGLLIPGDQHGPVVHRRLMVNMVNARQLNACQLNAGPIDGGAWIAGGSGTKSGEGSTAGSGCEELAEICPHVY